MTTHATTGNMPIEEPVNRHIEKSCRQCRHINATVLREQRAEAAQLDAAIAASLEALGYVE